MANKQAESDFASLCARYNIWCHKWRDVSYCPNCHKPIFMTQHTDQKDTGDNQQSIVDYLIFTRGTPHWVECKGKGGDTRFDFADLNSKQRNFLNSWGDRGVQCWLFLTLGDGKAPYGRKAWMIPWDNYLLVESYIESHGRKSIPWKWPSIEHPVNTTDAFKHWELIWDTGGWSFPSTHQMKSIYVVNLPPLYGVP